MEQFGVWKKSASCLCPSRVRIVMEMDFEIIILVYTDEGQYMKGQNLVEKNQRKKI